MRTPVETQPQALQVSLENAARALKIALTREQSTRLLAYVSLLQRWNAIHNLSASNDAGTLLHQHVIDCLAIVAPLTARIGDGGVRALDAGTGAGLPAVVLATTLPTWTVTAVDSVAKKVAFLRQVAGELALPNLRPVHSRLEDFSATPRFDVIICRAFGSLRHFVEQTQRLLQSQGFWVAMKGNPPAAEIADLPPNCQLFHVEPVVVPGVPGARCLVWIRPHPSGSDP